MGTTRLHCPYKLHLTKTTKPVLTKKKKVTQVYTNIQLDFIGREINTILLKWKLTFRLGDDTTITSQGLLIYYPLAELRYLVVHAVLSHWKRSLNGLDYCNLQCWLSARGYSPTAGSAEECACYRLPRHYHSYPGVNLRWNYWWFKLTPMLWNLTA